MFIQRLIEEGRFHHFSQSLFNTVDLKKVGGEILLRSELGTPDVIFHEARTANKLYELDTNSVFKALYTYTSQETTLKDLLFINIFPSTILHKDFPNFIKKTSDCFSNIKQNIVFEIIETDYVENIPFLKERIKLIKNLGYQIALDDVGKGWSSLNMIIELEPHYLKLDRYFSINLSTSQSKQIMIKSLLQYAHYSSSNVVLEGIEYEADLNAAKQLGVDICQGFLLEKPRPISIEYRKMVF